MNIAIIGSRDFKDYENMKKFILDKIRITEEIQFIVSGGAKGADTLAEKFADEFKIRKMIFLAEWNKFGKAAGMIRNKDIISNSDIVFAFWDGVSKGTANSIKLANKQNKKIWIYKYE